MLRLRPVQSELERKRVNFDGQFQCAGYAACLGVTESSGLEVVFPSCLLGLPARPDADPFRPRGTNESVRRAEVATPSRDPIVSAAGAPMRHSDSARPRHQASLSDVDALET